MERKTLIIILSAALAVIIAVLIYYFFILKKPVAQVSGIETFILSPANPSQSTSITIPTGTPLSFSIYLSNAKPNSTYTVQLAGNTYQINTDGNGNGGIALATSSISSNTTVVLTITGPCIPSAYVLCINVSVTSTTTTTLTSTTATTTTISTTTVTSPSSPPNYIIVKNPNPYPVIAQYIYYDGSSTIDYYIPPNSIVNLPTEPQSYDILSFLTQNAYIVSYTPPPVAGSTVTIPSINGLTLYQFINDTPYVLIFVATNVSRTIDAIVKPGTAIEFWAPSGWSYGGYQLGTATAICTGFTSSATTIVCNT
jgi:hypothetical protein